MKRTELKFFIKIKTMHLPKNSLLFILNINWIVGLISSHLFNAQKSPLNFCIKGHLKLRLQSL